MDTEGTVKSGKPNDHNTTGACAAGHTKIGLHKNENSEILTGIKVCTNSGGRAVGCIKRG